MAGTLDYDRGVRLVKSEFLRLSKLGAITHHDVGEPQSLGAFHRYTTSQGWNIDLEMKYGNSLITAKTVYEFFYTQPCAALTFLADQGTRIESARPEIILAFKLFEKQIS